MATSLLQPNGTISSKSKRDSSDGEIFEKKPQCLGNCILPRKENSSNVLSQTKFPLHLVGVRHMDLLFHACILYNTGPGYAADGMEPNSLALTAEERAACSEVFICEWEGRRGVVDPCLCLYLCFRICVYKNTYTHTHRKQNKQDRTVHCTLSSPRERAREQTSSRCEPCHHA